MNVPFTVCAVGVEASPDRDLAGVARQTRVLQRHGDEGAGLGEGVVHAAVIEGGRVLDQVAGGRDGVERSFLHAVGGGNDIDEGLDEVLLVGGLGYGRSGERGRSGEQQACRHEADRE